MERGGRMEEGNKVGSERYPGVLPVEGRLETGVEALEVEVGLGLVWDVVVGPGAPHGGHQLLDGRHVRLARHVTETGVLDGGNNPRKKGKDPYLWGGEASHHDGGRLLGRPSGQRLVSQRKDSSKAR